MDVLSILAIMQLLLVVMWIWLLGRTTRFSAELVELRARMTMMPTHTDLNALNVEVSAVKANTDQMLKMVNSIHNALMQDRK